MPVITRQQARIAECLKIMRAGELDDILFDDAKRVIELCEKYKTCTYRARLLVYSSEFLEILKSVNNIIMERLNLATLFNITPKLIAMFAPIATELRLTFKHLHMFIKVSLSEQLGQQILEQLTETHIDEVITETDYYITNVMPVLTRDYNITFEDLLRIGNELK